MRLARAFALAAATALLAVPTAVGSQPPRVPTATGTGGAAATVDHDATQAAIGVLRHGGNAVDAAVAAAAVLGVTEPFSCGIGGGGFMVIYNARDRKVSTIDHRERAPSAMHPASFFENGAPLGFDDARFSGLSAGVPGTVRGWEDALRRYGTWSLGRALVPGIKVASRGFEVDELFASQVDVDRFNDFTSTSEVYLDPDGTAPDVGTRFRNPDLARTYLRIARKGAKGFYRGRVAEAMADTVRNPPLAPDANHTVRPGVMTADDVKRYEAVWRKATRIEYRGLDVFGMEPPSSGGSTVGEALNILEGYPLSTFDRARAWHYVLEASRYSFADRNKYIGDPAFVDVPLEGLLSDEFAADRRSLITDTAANRVVEPGDPGQASADLDRNGTTTHLTVSDRWGNVVTYTFTIESIGGNGMVVPGWGFLLNNELTDFNFDSLDHANRVQGGKRPRSSMTPTIVLDDGRPVVAVGSPGGARIISTVLDILVNRLDFGATLPEALAAPRAHQPNAAATQAEAAFTGSPDGQLLVSRHGHAFTSFGEIGAATGIEFLPDGRATASAEPVRRGGGSAMVVRPR